MRVSTDVVAFYFPLPLFSVSFSPPPFFSFFSSSLLLLLFFLESRVEKTATRMEELSGGGERALLKYAAEMAVVKRVSN